MLGGNEGLAEQVVTELSSNPLTTFVTLLVKEEERQKRQEKERDQDKRERDRERRRSQDIPADDQQCR
jgi:hypothetical protein